MPEQTLADHMLAELARRQEVHRRLATDAEEAQAAQVLAQEGAAAAMRATQQAAQEVHQMKAAISALGYGPSGPEPQNHQHSTERTTP
mgnify:CR=1 FL=1